MSHPPRINILGGVVTLGGDVVPATNAIRTQNKTDMTRTVNVGHVTGYFTTPDLINQRAPSATVSWASVGEVTRREAGDFANDIHTVIETLSRWAAEYEQQMQS